MTNTLNLLLFIALPYVAAAVFLVGFIVRYRQMGFKVSSLSSQFLEGKKLFWGAVPFHIGILIVLTGHLTAFLLPQATLAWNAMPARLLVLEISAFSCGLSVLIGLVLLMVRRLSNPRMQAVTTKVDIAIELLLLTQVVFGCWVALAYRWGSSWFAADLSPYLWSLTLFRPDATAVYALPWPIKVHIVGAFLLLLMIPFSRLMHFMVAPFHYIGRRYQVVMWNWDSKGIREPSSGWSPHTPRN